LARDTKRQMSESKALLATFEPREALEFDMRVRATTGGMNIKFALPG